MGNVIFLNANEDVIFSLYTVTKTLSLSKSKQGIIIWEKIQKIRVEVFLLKLNVHNNCSLQVGFELHLFCAYVEFIFMPIYYLITTSNVDV